MSVVAVNCVRVELCHKVVEFFDRQCLTESLKLLNGGWGFDKQALL